jgi:hypothetical protein
MNRIVNGDIPPPTSVHTGYPRELERIVMRALSADPSRRYSSARMMQFDLEQLARDRKLNCTHSALGAYMHRLFAPRPFPWGALLAPGVAGGPPSSLATAADGRALASASMPGSDADVTPAASDPSYMGYSQSQLASLTAAQAKRSTLKGVAIGLGAAATAAVLAVGGLWYASERGEASSDAVQGDPAAAATAISDAVGEAGPRVEADAADASHDAQPAEPAAEPEPEAEGDPDGSPELEADAVPPVDEEVIIVDEPEPAASTRRKRSSDDTKPRSKRKPSNKSGKSEVSDLDALLPK